MKSPMTVLMPFTSRIVEQIEKFGPLDQIAPNCSGASVTAANSPDPIFELQGHPQMVAIAQLDRDLALTLKRLIDQLVEADFSEAAHTSDELSHRIRTNYLARLSDREGVAR